MEVINRPYVVKPAELEAGDVPLPDGANRIILRVARNAWPARNERVFRLDTWLDGDYLVGFTTKGGELKREDGNPLTHSMVARDLPPGTGRVLHYETEAYGHELSTALIVEVE